ncbi:MAG: B12-binding domain-containing radical SAM protein [Elusimicrobia bacterium]|nr:B12-binding domain-containing radical SAM protein [Candidatus Liberimonas magnetica]
MKRIVLINPPLNLKDRYGKLANAGAHMPPQGLGSLASFIRNNGYAVKILDCEALDLTVPETVEQVIGYRPDFVGITAVTIAVDSAAKLAESLKTKDEKLTIIIGGVHISALPEETMSLFPYFDIGVLGEGELTLLELLRALENRHEDLGNIDGLIFRKNKSTVKTNARKFIDNIDSLPFPAWDLYPEIKKYYHPSPFLFKNLPVISLVTSRGCPYRCSFCSRSVWRDKTYREHSAGYVFEMIKILYCTHGIREIAIYDDTFSVNKKRLIDLCHRLIKEKLDLTWSCNMRVNDITEPDLLKLMKKAGCWQIGLGIESGSQEILDFLCKDISAAMVSEALHKVKGAGLMSRGSIMIGVLSETLKSLEETQRFVVNSDLDFLTVNTFNPLPGSLDYQRAHQYGKFDKNWKLLNQYNYVFVPNGLTKEVLQEYVKSITAKFYFRFRPLIYLHYFAMCFSLKKLKIIIKGLTSLFKFAG